MKIRRFLVVLIMSMLIVGCGVKDNKENSNNNSNDNSNKEEVSINKQSNLGDFVKYNDDLYYWKINNNSRSSSALFGQFDEQNNSINELVKVDKDGKESIVLKDKGSNELVIVNDKIYTSYTVDSDKKTRMIYSVNLDGSNKKDIGIGNIQYINDKRIIASTSDQKIVTIDLKNNEYKELISDVELLTVKDDIIYYGKLENNVYTINSITGTDTKNIINVNTTDFKVSNVTNISFEKAILLDNQIDIYVGFRDGSAGLLNGLIKVTINSNGNASKEVVSNFNENSFTSDRLYYRYDSNNTSNSTLVYEDTTGKVTDIIKKDDIAKKYNLTLNDETELFIYNGSALDNDIYFVMDYVTHDSANDIGWRYSYKRNKTMYLKYNLSSKELEKIYEF